MKAIVFKQERVVSLEQRPDPAVERADDVIVKVEATGVCGTDRNIVLGRFPARPGVILGHESVGTVAAVGAEVRELAVGDRVVVNPTLYCGRCEFCRRGAFNFCDHKTGQEVGVDRDGTFATFVRLPARFLHLLPADLPLERAVFVEPLACVMNNAEAVDLQPFDDVAILGGGPIGLVFALYAQRFSRRTVVVERDTFRLSFARKLGVAAVDGASAAWPDAVIAACGGRRPSVIVETSGVLLDAAVDLVRKGGRIAVMGFNGHIAAGFKILRIVNNGIRVVGAGDYNAPVFPAAIDLAAELPLDRLITHRLPLDEHARAFQLLIEAGDRPDHYGAMKVLIQSA
ncbi:MAG TPA: alcohol dehydrogenase catalytic domain-containing protein [Polyangiaceae bacterium]|nr:alcohol dehydrogenase catalytic domain-containing protein [Polyangiaceae bacterium]